MKKVLAIVLSIVLTLSFAVTVYAKSGIVTQTTTETTTTTTTNCGEPNHATTTSVDTKEYSVSGVAYKVVTEVSETVQRGTKTVVVKVTTTKTFPSNNIEDYQNTGNNSGNNAARPPQQNTTQCTGMHGCPCGSQGHLPNPNYTPAQLALGEINDLVNYCKARNWNIGVNTTKCTKNKSVATITFVHPKSGTMQVIQTATKSGVGYTLMDGTYTDLASIKWSLDRYK